MRIWLHYWYQDLYTIPATHFSVDAGTWPRLPEFLSDNLVFKSCPSGSAIPVNGKLIAVRHQSVSSIQDLRLLHIKPDKRIWLALWTQHPHAGLSNKIQFVFCICFVPGWKVFHLPELCGPNHIGQEKQQQMLVRPDPHAKLVVLFLMNPVEFVGSQRVFPIRTLHPCH